MWRSAKILKSFSSINNIRYFRSFATIPIQRRFVLFLCNLIEIPVIYESEKIEKKWVDFWKNNVNLTPHPESKSAFTMVEVVNYIDWTRYFLLLV